MRTNEATPQQGAVAEAAALRAAISRLQRRLRSEDGAAGVGPTALGVLARLHLLGTASPADLAARERLRPQSLTRSLRALQAAHLVARAADPADRRRAVLQVTGAGEAVLRETMRGRVSWLARVLRGLSASERETVRAAIPILERLADG